MAVAKLSRPAGLQPIKQIQKKARVQGKKVHSAKALTKARRQNTVLNAKAKSGHGSPSVLRASKAARRAARESNLLAPFSSLLYDRNTINYPPPSN